MKKKYQIIYDAIKGDIDSGKYATGHQIPDEMSICRDFGCSRMTVKKAYDMLVNEGYIFRRQGQGSFVLARAVRNKVKKEEEHDISAFNRQAENNDTFSVLRFQLIFATEEIAHNLDIALNDPVYDILRIRSRNGWPYALQQTYMAPSVIPGMTQQILSNGIYNYIENTLGFRVSSAQRTARACCSNALDHKELKLKEHEPVFEVEQICYLEDGTPFEFSRTRHRFDRFNFSVYSVVKTP